MSIVPWIGGKGRLADKLLPLFPAHQCYVEPFAGAAALFFRKRPAPAEVLNDINGDLVNLYRVVQHHLEEFIRQFKWALTSRKIFEWQQATRRESIELIIRSCEKGWGGCLKLF
jgi:DNA adenine methylase